MTAQHERNHSLRVRQRAEGIWNESMAAQLEVPWRTNGLLGQIVFFLLTCVAVGAFYGLMHVLDTNREGLITGVAAIALAEYLIVARRWFFTGVEAALWLGGIFALISELPSSGKPEALLVLAAACAIAGARVRNPLFGALAAIFVMLYCEKRFDLGVLSALVMALGACVALLRTWRRPTTEALWIAIGLIMPIAGRFEADRNWRDTTIVLYAIFGIVALGLAIARRHHAFFLAAMISLAISATDVAQQLPAPNEAKLAIGGAILLAIAFVLSRTLRGKTRGLVLTPLQLTPFDDAAEIGATLAMQPATSTPSVPEPQPVSGGGNFGGAGASGDY